MSEIKADQLMLQMKVLAAQAQGIQAPGVNEAQQVQGADFSAMLGKSISAVNEFQQASGALKKSFEMGNDNVSMVDIAIASEKSKVAFTAMTKVRNELTQVYKDIMSIPV